MFPEEEKPKVQKGGSQFADVSQYLAANKPQAQRLASTIGQNVVSAGNQARQSLDATKQNFNQQVNSSTVPYNQALAQRAQQDPRSFYGGYAQIPQAPANAQQWKSMKTTGGPQKPTGKFGNIAQYLSQNKGGIPIVPEKPIANVPSQIAPASPQDLLDFQAMRDANYTGPNDLTGVEGYSDAMANEQSATDMTNNVGTEIGRQDLLNPLYEGSRGGSALDQALLGTGGASSILNDAAGQNADVIGAGEKANTEAMAAADAARATNAETASKIDQGMFGEGGAFRTLQDQYAKNQAIKGGGPWKKAQKAATDQDMSQRLDALNRLMGTGYSFGGYK